MKQDGNAFIVRAAGAFDYWDGSAWTYVYGNGDIDVAQQNGEVYTINA